MVNDRSSIPAVTLDTAPLPPEQQFAAWARHSKNSRLTPRRAGGFLAQGTLWMLGPVHVSDMRLDPFVSDRDRALVNATAAEHVQLVALYSGSVRLEAHGFDQLCVAPDLFVRDFARPSRATAGRIACATVYLARDFLEEAAGPLSAQGLLPATPETAILGATLSTIIQHLPRAQGSSAGFYARTLRDLLAAALTRSERAQPDGVDADRLTKARAYVASRPAGSVSVDEMVDVLGLSRSVLYGLFRPFGGVIAYDRLRRLRALYQDLCDTTQRRSIADLGAAHGFLDKAGLTRSFRATFGCSPRDVRERAWRNADPGDGASVADVARTAIESLA